MSTNDKGDQTEGHLHGGAAPSFFSAAGAVEASVVLVGCPPRENAGKAGAERQRQ